MGLHTAPEVARMFGVTPATIYNWIKNGKLEAVVGGDKKYQNKRGTEYRITDEAIVKLRGLGNSNNNADSAPRTIVKQNTDPYKDPFYDKGHVLSCILDYNQMTIAIYAKLRKYGGFAYLKSVLDGHCAIKKPFIDEFCTFFDTSEEQLIEAIKSEKVKLVKLREKYDIPENHSKPAEATESVTTGDSQSVETVERTTDELAQKYSFTRESLTVYYLTKTTRSTDNPNESEELPLMPMEMFRNLDEARKYLEGYSKLPKYGAFYPDENTVRLSKIDNETLKVEEVTIRIRIASVR